MPVLYFIVRPATPEDAEQIADAHVQSIRSVGAEYYEPDVIVVWGAPRGGERYRCGMKKGDPHFVAVSDGDILGFSVYHYREGRHRTGVYVRGEAVRNGVGSALFKAAEAEAIKRGATEIHVDASLAAVTFYKKHGFEELAPGKHRLKSGTLMDCVFMRKVLHGSAPGA